MGIDEAREIIIKYKDDPLEDIEYDPDEFNSIHIIEVYE